MWHKAERMGHPMRQAVRDVGIQRSKFGDARGVIITLVKNRLGDPSSNAGRGCLHFI